MNSLEIQYFLTIVKYGSFTEAAQTLSVSPPSASRSASWRQSLAAASSRAPAVRSL